MAKHLLAGALSVEEMLDPSGPALDIEDEPTLEDLLNYLEIDKEEIPGSEDMNQPSFFSYNGSAPVNSASTAPVAIKRCTARHDGVEILFRNGDKTIGGARGSELDNRYPMLIVDLSGTYSFRIEDMKKAAASAQRFIMSGPEKFKKLSEFIVIPDQDLINSQDILRLDWQDMRVPPVGLKFWQKLWTLLPKGHTVFCCMGAHGRTGTAIASMMLSANPKLSSGEAMQAVWDRHCEDAIETDGQMDYLRRLAESRPGGDGKDRALEKKGRKGKGY